MSKKSMASMCKSCIAQTCLSYKDKTLHILLGQSHQAKLETILSNIGSKMNLMSIVLTEQSNRIAAQKVRRTYQAMKHFQRIYGKQQLFHKIENSFPKLFKARPARVLLSAAVFDWSRQRVTDDALLRLEAESNEVVALASKGGGDSNWESVVDSKDFKVWRTMDSKLNLFRYRVFGNFKDIPARAFYNTQVDIPYWKNWDPNTIDVKIVDEDKETGSIVVYWSYRFPYPLAPRDYVFVRRSKINEKSNRLVITSQACEHPKHPLSEDMVRVEVYSSNMVIHPDTKPEENGFTYTICYYDNPKANFPTFAYKWMASTGVQDFLAKVHRATKIKLEKASYVQSESTIAIESPSENLYAKVDLQ